MTDRMAALSALVYSASPLAEQALQRFHALLLRAQRSVTYC